MRSVGSAGCGGLGRRGVEKATWTSTALGAPSLRSDAQPAAGHPPWNPGRGDQSSLAGAKPPALPPCSQAAFPPCTAHLPQGEHLAVVGSRSPGHSSDSA